ncbi:MAG: arylsulfatase [Rikenellaceae bacterium]
MKLNYHLPLVLLGSAAPLVCQAADESRPNVIIVITDDQGKGDLGCLGNDIVQTPNIDKHYEESVRLNNFHVSPTSGPTRSAIMTGRFTNRTSCYHTIGGRDKIYEDERLMPQYFAEAGYKTAMYGKWHLGDNYPYRPEDRGFQEVIRHGGGGIGQGPDYWGNDYFDDTYWHNSVPQKYEGYCTDVFFGEAMKFIEKSQDDPFFCYISLNAPHGPLHLPEKYYNIYKDADVADDVKRFYGMITNIDDNFLLLENKLEELGIADNTILIFMTDNGTATGRLANDGGMRGHKNSEYEGGHCVPFFMRWPDGDLVGGRDVDRLTAHIDMLPTLAHLCGVKVTPPKPLDGENITPLLLDPLAEWEQRVLVTDSQRLQNPVKWRKSATMGDYWRLINGEELYDLRDDKMQERDIAAENPEVVAWLRTAYEAWWASLDTDNLAQKYPYSWVGSAYENPVRISAHELFSLGLSNMWHQNGSLRPTPSKGIFKIRFVTAGKYKITICRYPLESGHTINEEVAAVEPTLEVNSPLPPSNGVVMTKAHLRFAELMDDKEAVNFKEVQPTDRGVEFIYDADEGLFDLEAYFTDEDGRFYTANYLYFEKL